MVSVDYLDQATASAQETNRRNKIEEIQEEEENLTSSIDNSSHSYELLKREIMRKYPESLQQRVI